MKAQKLALLALTSLLSVSLNAWADSADDVATTTGTIDLTQGGAYVSPHTAPTSTSDVTFTASTYTTTAFTGNTTGTFGTLDDGSATPITIDNTGSTATTLALAGGTNHDGVGAATGDLLYVGSGASLSIGTSSTAALTLSVGASAPFDVAGTLTLGSTSVTSTSSLFISVTNKQVTFDGGGTVNLNGAVTGTSTSDGIIVNNATVTLANSADTNVYLTVDTGTLNLTGTDNDTSASSVVNGGTFNLSGKLTASLVVNGGTFSESSTGIVGTGARTVTVNGGSATLGGTGNTYTGATTIDDGATLSLTGVLSTSTPLVLGTSTDGGGELSYGYAGTHTQTLGGTTLNAGASIANVTVSTDTLALAGITRTVGSTLDVDPSGVGTVTTTAADANFSGGQQTILGGYATYDGETTWAVSAGTGSVAGAITGLSSGSYDNIFVAGQDVNVLAGTSSPGSMTINSLRFNNSNSSPSGNYTVNLGGALTIATGGILETSTVGANAASINNSTLTSGNGQDLVVIQNNTAGGLTIGSQIIGSGVGLTTSGAGAVTLSGSNTYTGPTTVNTGSLLVATGGSINSTSSISVAGGATFGTVAGNGSNSTIGSSSTPLNLNLGTTTVTQTNLQLNLYGSGVSDTINASTLTLNNPNTTEAPGATVLVTLNDTTGDNLSGQYTLMTWTSGSYNTSEFSLAGSALGEGSLAVVGDDLFFNASAVPEPSTWAMMLGGLLLLVFCQRRQGSRRPGGRQRFARSASNSASAKGLAS